MAFSGHHANALKYYCFDGGMRRKQPRILDPIPIKQSTIFHQIFNESIQFFARWSLIFCWDN